jgi:Fe-S-cluster-containing dehydrogenase component
MICSLYHFGECNPELSAVRVARNEGQGLAEPVPLVCQQCDEPACMDACPVEAISKSEDSGIVRVDPDVCTGCGECVSACPAGCIFLDADEEKAITCDLCEGDPQCVPMCHSGSLRHSETDGEGDVMRVEALARCLVESSNEAAMGRGGE